MTRVLLCGTPDFAVAVATGLEEAGMRPVAVVTQPDKLVGRCQQLQAPPLKRWAEDRDIPVLQPRSLRAEAWYGRILTYTPDLLLTAAYGEIIPAEMLNIPPYGSLNVHASLLPKYRGASPIQAAIMAGEKKTGVTLMQMERRLDSGPILAQREVEIGADMTAGELFALLADEARKLVRDLLPLYISGSLEPREQDESQSSMTYCLKSEDGRLDFSRSAVELHNRIRGLSPWPGAYAVLSGKRVKLLRSNLPAKLPPLPQVDGATPVPGTIFAYADRIFVVCGEGILEIQRWQHESKAAQETSCCAHNYRTGYCFSTEE